MLRRDTNARFIKKYHLWSGENYHFQAGRMTTKRGLMARVYEQLLDEQEKTPVVTMTDPERRRTWWMFKGDFYWEDEGFDEREVQALILDRLRRRERRVEKAVTLMEQGSLATVTNRAPISDEVKVFVWNRDGGECVKCGGRDNLEFDHIIPLSKGGSSTARNLQLLCEACNRSKGDSLV